MSEQNTGLAGLTEIATSVLSGQVPEGFEMLPPVDEDMQNPPILSDEEEQLSSEEQTAEETQPEAKPEEKPAVEAKPLVVRDADGKAYKLKVDLSDEKQVQTLAQKAFEAQRLRAQLPELQEKAKAAQAYEEELTEIKGILAEKGVAGIVDYLLDEEGAYEKTIEEERQRRNLLDSQDPADRDAALKEYELEKRERMLKAKEEGLTQKEVQAKQAAEQAAADRMQSMYNSAWQKHSFDGKLGDPEVEDMFNLGVHNTVSAELAQRAQAGERLSQAEVNQVVERAFAKARKALGGAVDKQLKQETQASKVQASKALDARTAPPKQGTQGPQAEALQAYKKGTGSLADVVKAWMLRK